ncbi:MAG: tetratricopeptide repeat protein [Candidatus Eremiobacterota bacterium]
MIYKISIIFIIFLFLFFISLPAGAQTSEEWVKYGNQVFDQGKYEEAIQYYDAALNVNANNAEAWFNRGSALYYLGKYKEAIKCYDNVLIIDPNNSYAKDNKAAALQAMSASGGNQQTNQQANGFDYVIEGGRIGPFQVGGVTMEQVKDALGNPGKVEDNSGASCVVSHYPNIGMIFYFSSGQVLSNIITTNPKFQTSKGIKVGSRIDDVKKLYQGSEVLLKQTTQYDYIKNVIANPFGVYLSYTGIRFIFSPSYTVVGIEVGQ